MGELRRYLQLQAQAKTGLNSGLIVCGLLAVVFGMTSSWMASLLAPLDDFHPRGRSIGPV